MLTEMATLCLGLYRIYVRISAEEELEAIVRSDDKRVLIQKRQKLVTVTALMNLQHSSPTHNK